MFQVQFICSVIVIKLKLIDNRVNVDDKVKMNRIKLTGLTKWT